MWQIECVHPDRLQKSKKKPDQVRRKVQKFVGDKWFEGTGFKVEMYILIDICLEFGYLMVWQCNDVYLAVKLNEQIPTVPNDSYRFWAELPLEGHV